MESFQGNNLNVELNDGIICCFFLLHTLLHMDGTRSTYDHKVLLLSKIITPYVILMFRPSFNTFKKGENMYHSFLWLLPFLTEYKLFTLQVVRKGSHPLCTSHHLSSFASTLFFANVCTYKRWLGFAQQPTQLLHFCFLLNSLIFISTSIKINVNDHCWT